jgi:pyridoxal phosphate enzyme (YggS family)
MDIASNIRSLLSELPNNVTLVAISKTRTIEEIMEAYHAGHRIFGENKVQEIVHKYQQLPKDIEWHLVGHLQSNKVKYIGHFVHLIHSVDSLKLLREIDKQAKRHNKIINCLLEVYIAEEKSKYGLNDQKIYEFIESPDFAVCDHVRVVGLMGIATLTDNKDQIRKEFRHLAELFKKLKVSKFKDNPEFKELSMGMSSDFLLAIEAGSTMVRVGSKIFGERN